MEYKILKVKDLNGFEIRDIRQNTVAKLKERIEKHGYNNSRPLTIINKDGKYLVADGNHRLKVLNDLNIIEVPCFIVDDDIYKIAIKNNLDEDTYSKMDLFDWLDIIKKMKDEGFKQIEIADKLVWSKDMVNLYLKLQKKISTDFLFLCRTSQKGRVDFKSTAVDFTEGWFRDSGLYDLSEEYQLKFFELFKASKFKWDKSKVQRETAKLKLWQEFILIAKDKLVNQDNLESLVEMIENDNFKNEGQLLSKINDLNKESANKLICGDCLIELEKLEDCSIDLVITDPPYGIDYKSNHSKYDDYITREGIENDKLSEALELLDKTCEILKRKTKANSHIYIFTSWKVYPEFKLIIEKYFDIKNCIIWDKGNASMGDLKGSWGNQYEMIIFAKKGNRNLNKREFDILNIPRVPTTKAIHPTQKPEQLIKKILEVSAQKADTVCDPFMGSGSTIKAVKDYNNLNYIGIEFDQKRFDKAVCYIRGEENE